VFEMKNWGMMKRMLVSLKFERREHMDKTDSKGVIVPFQGYSISPFSRLIYYILCVAYQMHGTRTVVMSSGSNV
jgi:hypothetical protein